jgi:hypothetical protein
MDGRVVRVVCSGRRGDGRRGLWGPGPAWPREDPALGLGFGRLGWAYGGCRRGTVERYRQNLRDVILPYKETEDKPTFGERDFRSIKRSEINALHASLSETKAAANSVLGTISSLFTWIYKDLEIEDLRNPAFGIDRFPLKKRERFLTPEERQRVQAVIDAGLKIPAGRKGHLHIATVWAFDLLALTGRRRNEIVLLKWAARRRAGGGTSAGVGMGHGPGSRPHWSCRRSRSAASPATRTFRSQAGSRPSL